MIRRIAMGIATALLVVLPAVAAAQTRPADAIVGLWRTEETENGHSHIEIYLEADRYCGQIVWLSDPLDENGEPRVDAENKDEARRDDPVVGLRLMHGFRFDEGSGKWKDGRIYDPENGKEYRCKLTLKDAETLEVFGYVKVGFIKLGRDTIWRRVTTTP